MSARIKQDLSIGHNLKRMRLQNHLSQEEVVAKLQTYGLPISREILSQMERGRYSVRVGALVVLKELYHVGYDDFFQGLTPEDVKKAMNAGE